MAKAIEKLAAEQNHPVEVDISKAEAAYANFCRVTGTPEELIIDLGLNLLPMAPGGPPVEISQQIVVSYYTAKRMLGVLHMSIHRHEEAFGVLETDVQKRLRPSQQGPGPAGA